MARNAKLRYGHLILCVFSVDMALFHIGLVHSAVIRYWCCCTKSPAYFFPLVAQAPDILYFSHKKKNTAYLMIAGCHRRHLGFYQTVTSPCIFAYNSAITFFAIISAVRSILQYLSLLIIQLKRHITSLINKNISLLLLLSCDKKLKDGRKLIPVCIWGFSS